MGLILNKNNLENKKDEKEQMNSENSEWTNI